MRLSFRKICPWLIGALLLLWIYIAFYSKAGYQEMLIPSGTEVFTASFSRVSEIIPINEDVSQYALVEENTVSVTVELTDLADGTVHQVDIVDSAIHTDGYANKDNVHAEGLPIALEVGHTYAVQYRAVCNGQPLDDLSLAFYGEKVSYLWLIVVVLITLLAGIVGWLGSLRPGKGAVPAMLLLWCSVYVLYLLGMPLQLRNDEERAFARAYAVSNEMMGRETEDENGYVYVSDVGLRNSGYLSYDIPFYRFWSHIGDTADSSIAATVTYQDNGVRTPRTYIDAVMMTLARRMNVSYPLVYLAVAIGGGILGAIVLAIVLCCVKSVSSRIRVLCVALLPSVISVLQLHSGITGLFRPFESTYLWLQLDEILHRVVLYLDPSDGTSYIITFVPVAVIGMFVYRAVRRQTVSERMERLALFAMFLAVVVNSLLRLQM